MRLLRAVADRRWANETFPLALPRAMHRSVLLFYLRLPCTLHCPALRLRLCPRSCPREACPCPRSCPAPPSTFRSIRGALPPIPSSFLVRIMHDPATYLPCSPSAPRPRPCPAPRARPTPMPKCKWYVPANTQAAGLSLELGFLSRPVNNHFFPPDPPVPLTVSQGISSSVYRYVGAETLEPHLLQPLV